MKLLVPRTCAAARAECIDFLAGTRQPLAIAVDNSGRRSVEVPLNGNPSVIHFYD